MSPNPEDCWVVRRQEVFDDADSVTKQCDSSNIPEAWYRMLDSTSVLILQHQGVEALEKSFVETVPNPELCSVNVGAWQG
jgi:hypothetical protein